MPTRLTRKRTAAVEQEQPETDLQLPLGHRMREARPIGRGQARYRRHQRKADQRYEPDRKWRQQRLMRKPGQRYIRCVPAIVIGTIRPADVATALWIGLPYSVSTIVHSDPPLTPVSAAVKPDQKAISL